MKNLELKKVCEVCNSEFIGKPDKRACSKKCYMKLWRSENLEHRNNYKKQYYHNGNEEAKKRSKKQSTIWIYGMSVKEYDDLLEKQSYHCALCENTHDSNGYKLHVDHDHNCCDTRGRKKTCGKCNRGLLCGICNRKLGFLEKFLIQIKTLEAHENSWIYRALDYIQKYKVKI